MNVTPVEAREMICPIMHGAHCAADLCMLWIKDPIPVRGTRAAKFTGKQTLEQPPWPHDVPLNWIWEPPVFSKGDQVGAWVEPPHVWRARITGHCSFDTTARIPVYMTGGAP